MLPNIDTVHTIWQLEYQEHLRHAAQQRLAAGAQTGAPARLAPMLMGWQAALCRFGGLLPRLLRAKRDQVSPPLTSHQAQAARHAL